MSKLAAYRELIIEKDVDFEDSIVWKDVNGNYVNVKGDSNADAIFAISLRNSESSPLLKIQKSVDGGITFGAGGIITFSVARASIPDRERAYYSYKIYYGGKWYRLVEGPVLFSTEAAEID